MPMNAAFLNSLANHGAGLATHVGLVNGSGVELSGGGYARQPLTWVGAGATKNPNANKMFSVAAGAVVAGWRAYSALAAGTDYGGNAVTERTYTNPGTFELLAASTNFNLTAP